MKHHFRKLAITFTLIIPTVVYCQLYSRKPVLAISGDLVYGIPHFSSNATKPLGLRFGVEYPLGNRFLARCNVNSGSFKGDFDNNPVFTNFSNSYTQLNASIGFNLFEFIDAPAFRKTGFYLHAGGGYLFSNVTATREGGSFKEFEKRFWIHTIGVELRYDISKRLSLTAGNTSILTQTYYLDGVNNVPSTSTIYKYEWFNNPSVGIVFRLTSPNQPKPIIPNDENNIPNIPPGNAIYGNNTNEYPSNSTYPRSSNNIPINDGYSANIEALLTRIAASQDAIEKILANSLAFEAMRHDSISSLLKAKATLDSSFYASLLGRDSIPLPNDSLPDSMRTYFTNTKTDIRYPILAGNKYNVVVATYSVYDIDKAIDFIQNNPDYNLYLISGNKNSTKVRVCTHSTDVYANALTKLNLVRGKLEERAWIYKK